MCIQNRVIVNQKRMLGGCHTYAESDTQKLEGRFVEEVICMPSWVFMQRRRTLVQCNGCSEVDVLVVSKEDMRRGE
jgi:hypothetical protein